MTNNQLTEFAERKVKHLTQAIGQSAFTSIRLELENELALAKFALSALQEHRKAAEPVGGDELDHLIWGLERYGLYPRQLAALKELRAWRKAAAVPVAWLVGDVTLYNPDTVEAYAKRSGLAVVPLYTVPKEAE